LSFSNADQLQKRDRQRGAHFKRRRRRRRRRRGVCRSSIFHASIPDSECGGSTEIDSELDTMLVVQLSKYR